MSPETIICNGGPDEYRCAPVVRFPMGASAELLYFPLKKIARVITPSESALLATCSRFATLDAHAERIIGGLPAGSAGISDALEALRAFAANGMMLSSSDLMRRLASLPRPEDPPRIAWLAVPTCDRPQLLRRALASYAAHFSRTSRFPKLLVADDSRTPEAVIASREAVQEQAKSWQAQVVYTGPEEKRRLIDKLAKDGVAPREVLEFGIFGPASETPTMGANRNVILLQTAGEMVLNVDDDTLCQPCAAPETDLAGVRLGSDGDPTEFWFFPNRESASDFVRPADVDVLAAHERFLGREVWSLVKPGAGVVSQADLRLACGHLLESVWIGNGSVPITLNGSVGDSGMYSGRNIPIHRNLETRRRLLRSEADYRSALESREILRQARSATVCHGSPFMGMFFGSDNRRLLPPFFPLGRNEDGIFGYGIARCLENSFFAYLPWSLIHDPPSGRVYFADAAATVRISDIVIACISSRTHADRGAGPATRLPSLGTHLVDLASMTQADFGDYIRTLLWQQAGQRVAQREATIRQYDGRPDYWAQDLQSENETAQMAAAAPDYAGPIDLASPLGTDRLHTAQELARDYGRLLSCWPAIMEGAREYPSHPGCLR